MFHCFSMAIAKFGVGLCTAFALNIFATSQVPLFEDDGSSYLVDANLFFMLQNLFIFFGDAVSRKVAYWVTLRKSVGGQIKLLSYVVLVPILGVALLLTKYGIFSMLGCFLVFFGNGFVYGSTTRFVDHYIPRKFHLIVFSVWLLLGDLGSVSGGLMVVPFHALVCGAGAGGAPAEAGVEEATKHYHVCVSPTKPPSKNLGTTLLLGGSGGQEAAMLGEMAIAAGAMVPPARAPADGNYPAPPHPAGGISRGSWVVSWFLSEGEEGRGVFASEGEGAEIVD